MSAEKTRSDQGVRARNRARMEAEILRHGREQLVTRGAAALSLREIARDLGVASSAVYRYVADRDALLTRLLVDAYSDLADHVESALAEIASESAPLRLAAFAHAMRGWARENPSRWGLVYGAPVPGYDAPPEETTAPGTRLMAALVRIIADGTHAAPLSEPTGAYRDYLVAGARELGLEADPARAAAAVPAWSLLVGTVRTEVFGQLGPEVDAMGAHAMDDAVTLLVRALDLR